MVEYIRAVSELTVRVSVKYVSDSRPATAPDSGDPYPGYSFRGQRKMTVGTGYVYSVCMVDFTKGKTCQCKECRNSSTPEMNFTKVNIRTAAHVVFDESEGEHTTCHLCFDRGSTPDTCSDVVALIGMFDVRHDVNEDTCYMTHYSHDVDLAYRLHQAVKLMYKERDVIYIKMPRVCKFTNVRGDLDKQPLLFIVSHPHGCRKHVSLGRWTSTLMFYNNMVSFQYDTATCPGSSGAGVCVLQVCRDFGMGILLRHVHRVHCGVDRLRSEFNFCNNDGGQYLLVC